MKNKFIKGLRYACAFPFYVILFVLMIGFLIVFAVAMLFAGFADAISGRKKEESHISTDKLIKFLELLEKDLDDEDNNNTNETMIL